MKARRAHAKSHFGCAECKEKRVKCDEGRPKCSRCTKRNSSCTYGFIVFQNPSGVNKRKQSSTPSVGSTSTFSRFSIDSNSSASSNTSPTSPTFGGQLTRTNSATFVVHEPTELSLPKNILLPPDFMGPEDRKLFAYYNEVVCSNVVTNSIYGGTPIWGNALREHAPAHPFLFSGMLTLAAFHYAMTQGGEEWRRQHFPDALRRQTEAMESYRGLLANLKPETFEPALAFAGIIIITAFARSSALAATPEVGTVSDPIHEFNNMLVLFRGLSHLYKLSSAGKAAVNNEAGLTPVLKDTIMGAKQNDHSAEVALEKLKRDFLSADSSALQVNHEEFSDWLYAAGSSVEEAEEIDPFPPIHSPTEMYISTIARLKLAMRRMAAYPGRVGYMLVWPSTIAPQYIAALEKRRPLAIILLTYWCAALNDSRDRWWVNDFGKRVILQAQEELGREWQPYLRWPVEHLAEAEKGAAPANRSLGPAW